MSQVAAINDKKQTALTQPELKAIGLCEEDLPAVRELASKLDASNPLTISEFGREVSEHTSRYADNILSQINNKDLDEAGAKLTQVVRVARSLNMNALSDTRSRIPLIGGLIDRFRLTAQNIKGEFDNTREQIESLVGEVQKTQQGLSASTQALEDMFEAVKVEHHLLGMHIAAGKMALQDFRAKAEDMRMTVNEPTEVQELADLDSRISNLDKRIGDLQTVQQSALQSLPAIRLIQSNNIALVDKFHTIREVTVPAWKRQFTLALTLNQQKNAVELTKNIDDTTNELLRRNAELLYTNSVETAKSNQRLAIDVETLKEVQNQLIKTVEDVIQIQRDGEKQRAQAEKDIIAMRDSLRVKFTKTETTH